MSNPPFVMSKYATKEALLTDKCAWQEQHIKKLEQENAELKRIIAEMRAVDSPDFEKLKELGWAFNLCEICGESLSASKPAIQEGMQLVPIEPTKKMIQAANKIDAWVVHEGQESQAEEMYKAMLNASKEG